jgi:voltage-gated potassium channel
VAVIDKYSKHAQLLTALIATEISRPLMAWVSLATRLLSLGLLIAVGLTVFRALFDTYRRRLVGSILAIVMVASSLGSLWPLMPWQPPMDVISNVSTAAFYSYVLAVIVSHIFAARQLRVDDIVGVFSGYMLIALLWGRLYALVFTVMPGNFNISPDVRWQLANWNTLHALFDYYSFTNLASVGYSGITTTGPLTDTLVWTEVMCGQFYLAVVVATIVAVKISQILTSERGGT